MHASPAKSSGVGSTDCTEASSASAGGSVSRAGVGDERAVVPTAIRSEVISEASRSDVHHLCAKTQPADRFKAPFLVSTPFPARSGAPTRSPQAAEISAADGCSWWAAGHARPLHKVAALAYFTRKSSITPADRVESVVTAAADPSSVSRRHERLPRTPSPLPLVTGVHVNRL
eukprot:ctg_2306.g544